VLLLTTAAWALFAFAGIYRWTTAPLALLVAMLAFVVPPRIARPGTRLTDFALIAAVTAIAIQLIPLPFGVRSSIAPSSIAYEQVARVGGAAAAAAGPITVDRDATAFALFITVVILVFFWCARTAFRRGGVRTTIRGIAIMGAIIVPLALLQHARAPRQYYFMWRSHVSNALVFTPFINRNDFASWLVMALPLTGGYAVARIQSRRRTGKPFDPESALDDKGLILAAALLMMVAGLLASLSRSGVSGAAAALLLFVALSRGRMSRRWIAWMLAGTAAMIVLAAIYAANLGALTARFSGVVSEGLTGRVAIWRQTWPIVRDFSPVGTGVGAYQEVMVLYQTTTSRLFYISHADNEFLQVLAEGGLLLGIPVALALVSAVRTIARRLRADHTPLYWIRAGAASGLLAAGVQNLFEMTLRVPANAVLLALLAAIASHDGGSDSRR
jgi:O-antigen ligase